MRTLSWQLRGAKQLEKEFRGCRPYDIEQRIKKEEKNLRRWEMEYLKSEDKFHRSILSASQFFLNVLRKLHKEAPLRD